MNADLLIKIVAVVALIVFLVGVIMSSRSWKAHTIVMVCFVFLAGCTAFAFSVLVLRTQQQWREILVGPPGKPEEGLIWQTEKFERENHELEYGKEKDDGQILEDGIVQLQQQLRAKMYDRGRIWMGCRPAPMAGNSGTVTLTVSDPVQPQITPNLVVYLFDSKPLSEQGAYLGEFKVTNVANPAGAAAEGEAGEEAAAPGGPVTVTLEPAWPLWQFEMSRLAASANLASADQDGPWWSMLDKMPVDGHEIFAGVEKASAAQMGLPAEELNGLDLAGRLGKLLPERVVGEFLSDYKPAAADAPPERTELFVKFKDDYPKQAFGDVPFQYKKKQTVWLAKLSGQEEGKSIPGADDLLAQGVVELVAGEQPRYARALRDYGFLFRELRIMQGRQQENVRLLEIDTAGVNTVLADKLAIVAKFETELAELTHDRNGFAKELRTVHNLLLALRDQTMQVGRRMNQLRQENLVLAKRLDEAQMKAVEAIDRRSPRPQARLDRAPRWPASQVAGTTR